MTLANGPIAGLGWVRINLRFREPAEEEQRSEQEAEHDRYSAVVVPHPCLQGAEHLRGAFGHSRKEADEREHRDGEDHEHKHECRDAALKTKARRNDQVQARDEDREVLDLDREERHPEPERRGRRHGVYRLHPLRWGRVWIRRVRQAPYAKDDEQGSDRHADDTASRGDDTLRPAEENEPRDAYDRAGSEVPEREGTGIGEGPLGTQEQDGEEEQGGRDRATDVQDDEPRESVAHGYSARRGSGNAESAPSILCRQMTPNNGLPQVFSVSANEDSRYARSESYNCGKRPRPL